MRGIDKFSRSLPTQPYGWPKKATSTQSRFPHYPSSRQLVALQNELPFTEYDDRRKAWSDAACGWCSPLRLLERFSGAVPKDHNKRRIRLKRSESHRSSEGLRNKLKAELRGKGVVASARAATSRAFPVPT